jgi:hypothetical protein
VAGFGDAAAAGCFEVQGPGDAQPIAGAAAGVELCGLDPVVDDADAATETGGGFGDADLSGGVRVRGWDLVGVADPLQAAMSKARPWPVGRPTVLKCATRSWLLILGPSRRIGSTASVTVFWRYQGACWLYMDSRW